MTPEQELMLAKVERFAFDPPDAVLTFVKRFAREHKVSEDFAARAADEYLKFMFLCAISETELTPSHTVDLVWHLHMTYTENYWVDLCQNTLGKRIHHKPTVGGKANAVRFREQYIATLTLYNKVYGCPAPTEYWESVSRRFVRRHVAVDQGEYWLIKKPKLAPLREKYLNRPGRSARKKRRVARKPGPVMLSLIVAKFVLLTVALAVGFIQDPTTTLWGLLGAFVLFVIFAVKEDVKRSKKQQNDEPAYGETAGLVTYTGRLEDDIGCDSSADTSGSGDGDSGCGGDGCGGCGGAD